jgi:methionyl-tRNA synthetase
MNPYTYPLDHSFGFTGMNPFFGPGLGLLFGATILLMVLWSLIWKGIALWHSARNKQKVWFIVLLIVNTLGILEIIYILFFRKNMNGNVSTTTVTHTTTTVPPVIPPAVDSSTPVA